MLDFQREEKKVCFLVRGRVAVLAREESILLFDWNRFLDKARAHARRGEPHLLQQELDILEQRYPNRTGEVLRIVREGQDFGSTCSLL